MDALSVVKRSPIVFPIACIAAIAMVVISEASYWQSERTLNNLGTMAEARTNVLDLERSILNAETKQRGYLLTDRQELSQAYGHALKDIDKAFQFLDHYYKDAPRYMAVLQKLHVLTETKLSELTAAIRLHEEGQNAASTEFVLSDLSKKKIDTIRTLSAELLSQETQNITAGRTSLHLTLLIGRVGMASLSAISLLAIYLYLRQAFGLKVYQQARQHLIQSAHDRLEIEVGERTLELTELTHHIQTAREDERNRLARNLHDDLGSLLTSAKLDAARIKSRLIDTAPEALERLNHLIGTLNSCIALGRRIIEDLRPSTLSHLGLAATLEIQAREFAQTSGIEVHRTLEPVNLTPTAELVVYRLVQEAITNLTKYAQARHVWLTLDTRHGQIEVSVRDDGLGFDSSKKPSSAYGLVGMRFRVEAEGGTLAVVSSPGKGTLIKVTLPEVITSDS
ncbi:MAG: CHASE3 domain-containing protein [Pseudomonadota bacterium]